LDKYINHKKSDIKKPDEGSKQMPVFVKYGIIALALVVVIAVVLIVLLSTAGGYVATIGGEKVGTAEFKYYFDIQKQDMLASAQKVDPKINTTTFWSTKIGGETALVVAKKRTMDSLKDLKVQLSKAKEAKVILTNTEIKTIDDSISKNIITPYGSGNRSKADAAIIKKYGISINDIRDMQLEIATVQKFQTSEMGKINVADKDITTYYDKHPDWYKTSSMRTAGEEALWVKHILISAAATATQADKDKAKKQAEDILAKAKGGADFATLAKENSADSNAQYGGDYVFIKGQMVKEFENAAFSMTPGQIYDTPVKTDYGYHIIKLEEKYAKDQPVSLRCATEFYEYGTAFIKYKLYLEKVDGWKKDPKYNEIQNKKVYDSIN